MPCTLGWAPHPCSLRIHQELAHLGGAAAHVATAAAAGGASDGPHRWAAAGALRVLHLLIERGAMGVPAGLLPHLRTLQALPEVRCAAFPLLEFIESRAGRSASGMPSHLWAAAGALRVLHLLVERGAMGMPAGLLPHLRALQAHSAVCCPDVPQLGLLGSGAAGGAICMPSHLWAAAGVLRVHHLLVERGASPCPRGSCRTCAPCRPTLRCAAILLFFS